MAKTSKHAARLRELGCTPFNEILSPEDMDDVDDSIERILGMPTPNRMSRKQRRELVKRKVLPGFLLESDCTYVVDETGTDWKGPPGLELEPFGFCNMEKKLSMTLKKKMH